MTLAIISLLIVYFILGFGIIRFVLPRKQTVSRNNWTKYITYIIIVFSAIILLEFKLFHYIFHLAIISIGFYEIVSTHYSNLKHTSYKFILFIIIFTLLTFIFLNYALNYLSTKVIVVYALVVVFDGFSQLSGQLFGKRLLAKRISPAKTWEGWLGGSIMVLITLIILNQVCDESINQPWILLLSIIVGGLLGDLAASYFKRTYGLKDFNQLLPGHGGVLDRFDSYMGAGVFYYLITHFRLVL